MLITLHGKPYERIADKFTYYCYSEWHHDRHSPRNWLGDDITVKENCYTAIHEGCLIYICKRCHDNVTANILARAEQAKIDDEQIKLREKKELPDSYVIKKLRQQNKFRVDQITQPIIELKRATLKLKNQVEEAKKPLMTCIHHGDLYLDSCIKAGKSRHGKQRYRCRQCMSHLHNKHYLAHTKQVRAKNQEWRENNREKIKEIHQKYFEKRYWGDENYRKEQAERWQRYRLDNPEKHRARNSRYKKKCVDTLADTYVIKTLISGTGLKTADIPQSLIELKRATIRVKRAIKTTQQGNYLKKIQEKLDERASKKHQSIKK